MEAEANPHFSLRTFGSWRPELPDHRDRPFLLKPKGTLPRKVDPFGMSYRRHDQGALGSCTGHAATSVIEIAMDWDGDANQLSRLMAYYHGRLAIGEELVDYGAYNRDVIKGFINYGVARETKWPYNPAKFAHKPSATAYKDALLVRDKIRAAGLVYERIETLDQLLSALALRCPVMFGFTVTTQFYGITKAKPVLPVPTDRDDPIGGHAVYGDGYDLTDPEPFIWVGNSWGRSFGISGYFKMPLGWWMNRNRLVDDMWAIRKTAVTA